MTLDGIALTTVKRTSDALWAHCHECDTWLGCPYWSLAKSVALHKRGTGHVASLYTLG